MDGLRHEVWMPLELTNMAEVIEHYFPTWKPSLERSERKEIAQAMVASGLGKRETARSLGVDESTVRSDLRSRSTNAGFPAEDDQGPIEPTAVIGRGLEEKAVKPLRSSLTD